MSETISLETLLAELADTNIPLRAALIYRLSEINLNDQSALKEHWQNIPTERRQILMSRLTEASEANFELDFSSVALFALEDGDSQVREHAVSTLWIGEDIALMRRFIKLLETDEAENVRAAAASSLGRFVLAAELDEIPSESGQDAQEALLQILNNDDEPLEVYRRALESLAFSGQAQVPSLIEAARLHPDLKMQASALFAIGRTADPRWKKHILISLDHEEPELRFEAARAAGELGIISAVNKLIRLAQRDDHEIREVAIWSLGEIGGKAAQNALFELARRERDEDLREAIEDAMSMSVLGTGDFGKLPLDDALDDDEDDDVLFDDEFDDFDDED